MTIENTTTIFDVKMNLQEMRVIYDSLQDHEHQLNGYLGSLENEQDREAIEDELFATRRLKSVISKTLESTLDEQNTGHYA